MKILLLRCTLAILMCRGTIIAMADNDIINEDFYDFSIEQGWTNNNPKIVNNWSFYYSEIRTLFAGQSVSELVLKSNNNKRGYAITPEIDYIGNATLSFYIAATAKNTTATLSITINNGTINNVQTLENISSSSQTLTIRTYNLTLRGDATIRFSLTSTAFAVIDDVVITPIDISLSESANNKNIIDEADEKTINVQTSRTLKHGIWNTMCLPFEVTTSQMQQALGTADFQMRTYTGHAGRVMTFTTASTIPAGTPFLVKPNTEEDIANPTFEYVTIKATADTVVNHNGVKFIGTYSGRDLNIDGTHLFITTDGTVARPASNTQNHLKGLRAYIEVPSSITNARLNIDGETVDIQQIDADNDYSTVVYDLKGLRLERPKKGLCIKDGKLIFIK